jgi:hypothetical protein
MEQASAGRRIIRDAGLVHPGKGCVSRQTVKGRLTSHRDKQQVVSQPAGSQCPMKPHVFCKVYVFTLSLLDSNAVGREVHKSVGAALNTSGGLGTKGGQRGGQDTSQMGRSPGFDGAGNAR